jgi:hypothetical protein
VVAPAQVQHRRRQRQHDRLVDLDQLDRAGLGRAHHPGVRRAQPRRELVIEILRGLEVSAGHERGLEETVAAFHDALGLRIARRQEV